MVGDIDKKRSGVQNTCWLFGDVEESEALSSPGSVSGPPSCQGEAHHTALSSSTLPSNHHIRGTERLIRDLGDGLRGGVPPLPREALCLALTAPAKVRSLNGRSYDLWRW